MAVLDWIAGHSQHCAIVVGDDLYRFNVMINTGLNESEALKISRKRSRTEHQALLSAVAKFKRGKFDVHRWSEFTSDPSFSGFARALEDLFADDEAFRTSVNTSALEYMERRPDRHSEISRQSAIILCRRYLLEEMAVFCVLVSQGSIVDIYPGPELPILAEMSEGLYPQTPSPLQRRVGICLKVKKIT